VPAHAFAKEKAFIVDGGDFKELAQHRAQPTWRTPCQGIFDELNGLDFHE
jgi:hypothetical protein